MIPVIVREVDHEGQGLCTVIPSDFDFEDYQLTEEIYNKTTNDCEVWAIHGQEYESNTGSHFINIDFEPILVTRSYDIYAFKPAKSLNHTSKITWYARYGDTIMGFQFCQPLTAWEFAELLEEQQKYLIAYNLTV